MTKEYQIENQFIDHLSDLKYIYRPDIKDRNALEENFRKKFESLNRVRLTDSEFKRLREQIIVPDVFDASKKLREQQFFQREDGTPLQYCLVNIKDWCRNDFEVINQLRINTENSNQRYDVIILINGLPLVQIELKSSSTSSRKAMQQIVDYKNEPGNGYYNSLLCYMQLFIVSNRSNTIYFSNNKKQHFQFNAEERFLPVYEFADKENKKIRGLREFTEGFLKKCNLAEMISKYMVLVETEQKILVMRPYQIYAVKAIDECVQQNRGNGYIWHTTGSGKTLTSFKASTLLKENREIDKCLFVVDRKDLDRQTRDEFNKFQEGSVEENTNTETLVRRLLSTSYADKVIVTTIQKLGLALDQNSKRNLQKASKGIETFKERLAPLQDRRIVFIFDECHRSQFGDNHEAIKTFFPKAQLFGFTGTPIFPDNSSYFEISGEEKKLKTTEGIFEKRLHTYTITHAIDDENVLKFHVDYFKGSEEKSKPDSKVTHKAVVKAILKKHDRATNDRKFNAVMATGSINDAIDYYNLFKKFQKKAVEKDEHYKPLNIACVFSPPAQLISKDGDTQSQKNALDIKQVQEDLAQEKHDNQHNPEEKKKALIEIINDYNAQYDTNHDINNFDQYYQDVQSRIKFQRFSNRDYPRKNKIDITIVVDMLLTGFDSKYLNTLYVDKNLKYHGLIQAFSRTNRVLNDSKPYGNILDFRSQQDSVNQAIALFSGEDNDQPQEIWMVEPAPKVIESYRQAVNELGDIMTDHNLVSEAKEVYNLRGEAARIAFVKSFKEIQRLKTQLDQYTDLSTEQSQLIEDVLPKEKFLEFKSSYLETAKRFKKLQDKEGDKTPQEIQELDFEFVLFASSVIDYDYIMELIADSTQRKPSKQTLTKAQVKSLLKSNSNLMDEEEELSEFIDQVDWTKGQTAEELKQNHETYKVEKYDNELTKIARTHGLDATELKSFVEKIIKRMIFDGEKLTDLLESLELSWKERRTKELALMEDLVPQLKKLAQGREISGLAAYE